MINFVRVYARPRDVRFVIEQGRGCRWFLAPSGQCTKPRSLRIRGGMHCTNSVVCATPSRDNRSRRPGNEFGSLRLLRRPTEDTTDAVARTRILLRSFIPGLFSIDNSYLRRIPPMQKFISPAALTACFPKRRWPNQSYPPHG